MVFAIIYLKIYSLEYTNNDPVANRFEIPIILNSGNNFIYLRQYFPLFGNKYIKLKAILNDNPPDIFIDPSQFPDFIETWKIIEGIGSDNLRSVVVDKNDGSIWVGTYGQGIKKFDSLSDDTPVIFKTNNSELSNNYINDLYINDTYIWIATNGGGLSRIRKEDNTWKVFKSDAQLGSLYVTCIAEDNNGDMWFGTSGGGISIYSPDYGWMIIKNIVNPATQILEGSLTNNYIYSLKADRENNIWIGTADGKVSVFNTVSGLWKYFNLAAKRLWNTYVTSIDIDPDNNKWIGIYGGGLAKINEENTQVEIYLTPENLSLAGNENFDDLQYLRSPALNTGGDVYSGMNDNKSTTDSEYRMVLSAIGQSSQSPSTFNSINSIYSMAPSIIEDIYALNSGFIFTRTEPLNDRMGQNFSLTYTEIQNSSINYKEGGQTGDDISCIFFNSLPEKWIIARKGVTKIDHEGHWINYTSVINNLDPSLAFNDAYIDHEAGLILLATNKGLLLLKKIYLLPPPLQSSEKFIDLKGFIKNESQILDVNLTVIDSNNSILYSKPSEISETGFLATHVQLSDGFNTIEASARDVAGNSARDMVMVFVGTQEEMLGQDSSYYLEIKDLTLIQGEADITWSWDIRSSMGSVLISEYEFKIENIMSGATQTGISPANSLVFSKSALGNGHFRFSVRAKEAKNGLISPWKDISFAVNTIKVTILDEDILPDEINTGSYKAIFRYAIDLDSYLIDRN